ncbi:MAG: hypothetical protein JWM28_4422 [Chitinophagaceae bacterium]|nr:hypothetical protein [Chitinophagaceae bacterium]
MRSHFKYISLYLFSFLLLRSTLAAQAGADHLPTQFEDYARNYPQEKLFVHTDKSVYVAGEIIWFKVYVTDASSHIPIDLSKVAYIEILDNSHTPLLQAKIALQQGSGNGSFLLPASVNSGNLLLRAYTRWMRNSPVDFYFEKPITVINTLRNFSSPAPTPVIKYDIQFFPEGGNLVNGIESNVAFKIADQFGKGIDCGGTLLKLNNDTVLNFKTSHLGIGKFNFTPKAGESYKALVNVRKDTSVMVNLPAAYEKGFVMRVEDGGDQLTVTVSTDNQSNDQTVYLLCHTRQHIKLAEERALTGHKAVFTINKKTPGEGITVFTLFNQFKQPVCERLYFKRPEAQELDIKPDHENYSKRNKVTLDIATNKEEVSDLSLSVYHTDSLQAPDKTDILSYLWLSADLQGYIESPGYYFNPGTEQDHAADNLMLTHGWRRFKWDDILSNKKPFFEFTPEYEGHLIAGKIINKQSGMPAKNITAYLSAPAKKYQFTAAASNPEGQVLFNTKDFTGTEQIIVQTNSKLDSNYRVDIFSPYAEKFSETLLPALAIPPSIQNQLLYQSINSQVQTTYLNDSLNRFYFPFADTSHFFGPPEKVYYLDDYTRFTTMEEVLREYVMEVSPRKQNRKFHLYMLQNPHEFFTSDPLVLVDGVPFFDMDSIIAMDPLKINKIEVLSKKYYYGPLISDGIVSYSTYKGDLDGVRLDPNAVVMEYEGLQLQREFYSPVYETPAQKNSRVPDFRNLLYWAPDIKINRQNKTAVSFYTSDLEGKYFILVQGISASGKIFSKTAGFDVKK